MTAQTNGSAPVLHLAPGEGETLDVLGDALTFKVTSDQTGGVFVLAEITVPAGGGPPALHTHPPSEAFYVLEGEYEFIGLRADGPFTERATPGSVVYVPPGSPHNFKNVGSSPGRLLAVYTSSTMENLARELAAAAKDRPDPATLMPILAKHGIAFVGPPPTAR